MSKTWLEMSKRERDALVAEKAMGWRWMRYPAPNNPELKLTGLFPPEAPERICVANGYDQVWEPSDTDAPRFSNWYACVWWENGELQRGIPHYSTDIAAAWRVVERLQQRGLTVVVRNGSTLGRHYGGCVVRVLDFKEKQKWEALSLDSAPEAICLAALKAHGIELRYDRSESHHHR